MPVTDKPWNGDKGRFSIQQLARAVPKAVRAWAKSQGELTKANLKLPYKEPDGTINLGGVRAALAALGGARGGVQLPAEVKAAARKQLKGILARHNVSGPSAEGYTMTKHQVSETIRSTPRRHDAELGVVYGMKVLGWESRNRRRYHSVKAQSNLPTLYEGKASYLDHSTPGKPTSVRDRFANLREVSVEDDGVYCNYHYNPAHEFAPAFRWWVDNAMAYPDVDGIGLSHEAMVEGGYAKDGWLDVTAVAAVERVDLVADPGSVKSLFESLQKEDDVKLEELTVKSLQEGRPDLVEAIKAQLLEANEHESRTNALVKERDELRAKIDAYEVAEQLAQKRTLATKVCEDLKLPAEARTDLFMEQLAKAEDEAAMKALVEERNALLMQRAGGAPSTPAGARGAAELTKEGFQKALFN